MTRKPPRDKRSSTAKPGNYDPARPRPPQEADSRPDRPRESTRFAGSRAADRNSDSARPVSPRFEGSRSASPSGSTWRGGGRREAPAPHRAQDPERPLIWGYHSVREALRSKRREIVKLYATAAAAERLAPEIAARDIKPEIVEQEDLARRLPTDAVHQGVLAEALPLEAIDISELPANGLVLVLDQVTDPHNVGAILRTAAAYGVDGIVTTERHSPALTGVLAKSASGGLEHVPIVTVVNLARALEELGRMNYLRVGLDSEGPAALEATTLSRPLALVLGAEGKGLRRLSRENCDVLARLDMPGPIKSLNVSNACAVALAYAHLRL